MKRFKSIWTSRIYLCLFVATALLALTLIGCSNSPYYGPYHPPYPPIVDPPYDPQGWDNTIFLSSDSSISVRGGQAYKRFLEEIIGLCVSNRNTGYILVWQYHDSCETALQTYTEFAIDLHIEQNPQHNSRVAITFWVGSHSGYHYQQGVSWLPSFEYVGEFKHQDNGGFRVVYRPNPQLPGVVIRFNGSLNNLYSGRSTLKAIIEYEDVLGQGQFSIVEDYGYDYQHTNYNPGYPRW